MLARLIKRFFKETRILILMILNRRRESCASERVVCLDSIFTSDGKYEKYIETPNESNESKWIEWSYQ